MKRIVLVAVSVFLSLMVLEITLRLGELVFSPTTKKVLGDKEYRILALGESTTGLGGGDSWPSILQRNLNAANPGKNVVVINKGRPGATTAYFAEYIASYLDQYRPNLVVSMMGINDTFDTGAYAPVTTKTGSGITGVWYSLRLSKVFGYMTGLLARRSSVLTEGEKSDLGLTTEGTGTLESVTREADMLEQAVWQADQGDMNAADQKFVEFLETNPDSEWGYIEYANFLRVQGRFDEAVSKYRKALTINPNRFDSLLELGNVYRKLGELSEASEVFGRAGKIEPESPELQTELKWLSAGAGGNSLTLADIGSRYHHKDRYRELTGKIMAYIAAHPDDAHGLITLGNHYRNISQPAEAAAAFEKALRIDPKSIPAFTELSRLYRDQSKLGESERLLSQALSLGLDDQGLYKELELTYRALGRENDAEALQTKTKGLTEATATHYQMILTELSQRRIPLVAVQYPLRSVEALKGLLGKGAVDAVLVDNAQSFVRAIQDESYDAYFTDRFAGDFGHATKKGNELIAGNISGVILVNRERLRY